MKMQEVKKSLQENRRNNFNPLCYLAERKHESDTNLVNGQKGAR